MRVTDKIEKEFIRKVLNEEYVPGTKMPSERELATEFSVGRPVIREVLQRLERDGWLTIRSGQRAVVNDYWKDGNLMTIVHLLGEEESIPNDFIIHLLELRKSLSPAYVKDAVTHKPLAVIALLKESENVPDEAKAFALYDWRLQRGLAAASPNPIYLLILNSFQQLYIKMATHYFYQDSYRQASREYYRELMLASLTGDGSQAEYLVTTMMEKSIQMWIEQTKIK
ncbi:GntR family transcriptional regulator [Sutcliffiella halmapala]|uniref:GntR family transcriptional regulator n=1 Tax=Sutcliffiella halmapala TaxID=79882 RepID=UPI0009959BC3|nr:GntR family transcriptional regulator [Sutcliffiella halmapala]